MENLRVQNRLFLKREQLVKQQKRNSDVQLQVLERALQHDAPSHLTISPIINSMGLLESMGGFMD